MVLIFSKPCFSVKRSKAENISFNNWTICSGPMWANSVVKPTKSASSTVTSGWLSAMFVSPFSSVQRWVWGECSTATARTSPVRPEAGREDVWHKRRCPLSRSRSWISTGLFKKSFAPTAMPISRSLRSDNAVTIKMECVPSSNLFSTGGRLRSRPSWASLHQAG